MKPPAMQRALDRAKAAKWKAGQEMRRAQILALVTEQRELAEDYQEVQDARCIDDLRWRVAIASACWGLGGDVSSLH